MSPPLPPTAGVAHRADGEPLGAHQVDRAARQAGDHAQGGAGPPPAPPRRLLPVGHHVGKPGRHHLQGHPPGLHQLPRRGKPQQRVVQAVPHRGRRRPGQLQEADGGPVRHSRLGTSWIHFRL